MAKKLIQNAAGWPQYPAKKQPFQHLEHFHWASGLKLILGILILTIGFGLLLLSGVVEHPNRYLQPHIHAAINWINSSQSPSPDVKAFIFGLITFPWGVFICWRILSKERKRPVTEQRKYYKHMGYTWLDDRKRAALALDSIRSKHNRDWMETLETCPLEDEVKKMRAKFRYNHVTSQVEARKVLTQGWSLGSKSLLLEQIDELNRGRGHANIAYNEATNVGQRMFENELERRYGILSGEIGHINDIRFEDHDETQAKLISNFETAVHEIAKKHNIKPSTPTREFPLRDAVSIIRTLGNTEIVERFSNTYQFDAKIVQSLMEPHPKLEYIRGSWAWDLSRAVLLTRRGFEAGYLSRDEAWQEIEQTGKLTFTLFESWDAFFHSYMIGFCLWSDDRELTDDRIDIYNDLQKRKLPHIIRKPWPTGDVEFMKSFLNLESKHVNADEQTVVAIDVPPPHQMN